MALSPRLQCWLEARGIATSNDPGFMKIVPWLRTTYLLCASIFAIAVAFAFTPLIWVIVPIAAAGAIFTVHPFDLIYNYGLRHLTGTRPLPRNGAPTRFACGMATPWMIATALSFQFGLAPLGYALGGSLVAVAYLVGITHFCIPSFIWQFTVGDRALALRTISRATTEEQIA